MATWWITRPRPLPVEGNQQVSHVRQLLGLMGILMRIPFMHGMHSRARLWARKSARALLAADDGSCVKHACARVACVRDVHMRACCKRQRAAETGKKDVQKLQLKYIPQVLVWSPTACLSAGRASSAEACNQ
eukprot:353890-Chlamydomonas_euryale.AAC.5